MTAQSPVAGAPFDADQQKVLPVYRVSISRFASRLGRIILTGSATYVATLPLGEGRHEAAVSVHERLVVAVRDLEFDVLVLPNVGRIGYFLMSTLGFLGDGKRGCGGYPEECRRDGEQRKETHST